MSDVGWAEIIMELGKEVLKDSKYTMRCDPISPLDKDRGINAVFRLVSSHNHRGATLSNICIYAHDENVFIDNHVKYGTFLVVKTAHPNFPEQFRNALRQAINMSVADWFNHPKLEEKM